MLAIRIKSFASEMFYFFVIRALLQDHFHLPFFLEVHKEAVNNVVRQKVSVVERFREHESYVRLGKVCESTKSIFNIQNASFKFGWFEIKPLR